MLNIRKIIFIFTLLIPIFILSACFEGKSKFEKDWEGIIESGKESEIRIVYDSEKDFDLWINEKLFKSVLDKHRIKIRCEKLELSRLDTDVAKIKEEGRDNQGAYDLIILKADEVNKFKNMNYLYGPFTKKIPNFVAYMNSKNYIDSKIDFEDSEGKAVPFCQSQLSFFYNADLMFSPPETLEELKTFMEENPGKFIYPSPRSPEGKLFVQSVILSFAEEIDFLDEGLSKNQVKSLASPGLRYLNDIMPYLYGKGKFFPSDVNELDELYTGEFVYASMCVDQFHGDQKSADFEYPEYSRPFSPIEASASSDYYYAVIPFDSPNKTGAMLVLNEFLSPDMQASLFMDKNLNSTVVYSPEALDSVKKYFDKNIKKKTIIKAGDFLKKKKISIPEEYWEYILEEWDKIRL